MKIQTKDLTGAALDWAVCMAEFDELAAKLIQYPKHAKFFPRTSPHTDWSLAGPIIEREGMTLIRYPGWTAVAGDVQASGPTPLIAAMRVFVASKLGDEIEVPEELA